MCKGSQILKAASGTQTIRIRGRSDSGYINIYFEFRANYMSGEEALAGSGFGYYTGFRQGDI